MSPKFDPDSERVKNFQSFKVYVNEIDPQGDALEPFSGFCSFCSRVPPRYRRTSKIQYTKIQMMTPKAYCNLLQFLMSFSPPTQNTGVVHTHSLFISGLLRVTSDNLGKPRITSDNLE